MDVWSKLIQVIIDKLEFALEKQFVGYAAHVETAACRIWREPFIFITYPRNC